MATTATATRQIRVACGTLWKKWRDLPGWRKWQPGMTESRWLEGNPWQEGSTFLLGQPGLWGFSGRFLPGRGQQAIGRVLSTAEEQLLVWELTPRVEGPLKISAVYSVRLDPSPSGATVLLTITVHGPLASLFAPFMGGSLNARAEATLDALRREIAPIERRQ